MRWMWTSRLYRSEDVSQRERDARLSASWRNDQKSVKWHRADGLLLHHWIKILSDSWKSSAEVQYVFILILSVVRWDTPVSTRLVSSPLLLLSCPCPVSSCPHGAIKSLEAPPWCWGNKEEVEMSVEEVRVTSSVVSWVPTGQTWVKVKICC